MGPFRPKRAEIGENLPAFDYARSADLIGLKGIRMEESEDIAAGWTAAFASDRPVAVDAMTDPSVPPIPPHIDISQATAYAKAIFKGDPDAWATVKQSINDVSSDYKQRLRELVD